MTDQEYITKLEVELGHMISMARIAAQYGFDAWDSAADRAQKLMVDRIRELGEIVRAAS